MPPRPSRRRRERPRKAAAAPLATVVLLGLAAAGIGSVFIEGDSRTHEHTPDHHDPGELPGISVIPRPPGAPVAVVHVHMSGFVFNPALVEIAVGDSVEWHNHDLATHTATTNGTGNGGGAAPVDPFHSGNVASGGTWTRQFNVAGEMFYWCFWHTIEPRTSGMVGKVRVPEILGPLAAAIALLVPSLAWLAGRPRPDP